MPEVAAKQVLFVCPAGYGLSLTMKSEDFVAVEGRAIKVHSKRLNFRKMPYGGSWRGEYLTSDQEEIDYIRKHDWFVTGPIPDSEMGLQMRVDAKGNVSVVEGKAAGTTRRIYEAEYNPDEKRVLPAVVSRQGDPENTPKQVTAVEPVQEAPHPTKARIAKGLKKTP